MAMMPHPVTGVLINDIEIRHGRIAEEERQTARLLLNDGHARWVVAAMLGRFPLAFDGTGKKPADKRPRIGGGMSIRDAREDPRQIGMQDYIEDFFDDLFGKGTGNGGGVRHHTASASAGQGCSGSARSTERRPSSPSETVTCR